MAQVSASVTITTSTSEGGSACAAGNGQGGLARGRARAALCGAGLAARWDPWLSRTPLPSPSHPHPLGLFRLQPLRSRWPKQRHGRRGRCVCMHACAAAAVRALRLLPPQPSSRRQPAEPAFACMLWRSPAAQAPHASAPVPRRLSLRPPAAPARPRTLPGPPTPGSSTLQ